MNVHMFRFIDINHITYMDRWSSVRIEKICKFPETVLQRLRFYRQTRFFKMCCLSINIEEKMEIQRVHTQAHQRLTFRMGADFLSISLDVPDVIVWNVFEWSHRCYHLLMDLFLPAFYNVRHLVFLDITFAVDALSQVYSLFCL